MLWSKVGVTAPFFALVERMHQNWLRASPPPIKRLPFESTSGVPHWGELGILIGFIQVTPPSVERLNCLAAVIVAGGAPKLVLESVTGAVGLIYREPLLVASRRRPKVRPGLAAVERAPHVVKKCRQKAEIEKTPCVIGVQDRVAAEDVVLENAGEGPGRAAIAGVSIAGLPEVGSNAVELPPTDYHPVVVCWVDGDRWLVRGVAGDVLAARIDVNLITGEGAVLRDHSRRNLYSPKCGRAGGLSYFSSGSVRSALGGSACPQTGRSATSEPREANKIGLIWGLIFVLHIWP